MRMWSAVRCLRPCDRLSSPPSARFSQLIVSVDKMSCSFYCSLQAKVKNDSVESCEMSKAL